MIPTRGQRRGEPTHTGLTLAATLALALAPGLCAPAAGCRVHFILARVAADVDVRCALYGYDELRIVSYELLGADDEEVLASRSEEFLGQGLSRVELETTRTSDVILRVVLRDAEGVARLTGASVPFDLESGDEVTVGVVLACASASTVVEQIVPGRILHTATSFPDGRVLLAGGLQTTLLAPQLAPEALAYDPARGAIDVFSDAFPPRALHGAVALPEGAVLVGGGVGPGNTLLGDLWLIRPDGTLFELGSLPAPIAPAAMVLLSSGEVLIAGDGAAYRVRIDEGAPSLEGTTTVAGAPLDVFDMHLADVSGTGDRYVFAGGALRGVPDPPGVATAGAYENGFASLSAGGGATGALAFPRLNHVLATFPGTGDVLVFGGLDATVTSIPVPPEVYVSNLDGFVPVTPVDPRAVAFSAVLVPHPDGRLLAVGGAQFADSLWIARADDPATPAYELSFDSAPGLARNRTFHTVTRLPGGGLLVAGGLDAATATSLVPEVEVLSP